MKQTLLTAVSVILSLGSASEAQTIENTDKRLDSLFSSYDNEAMKFTPIDATYYGDNRYNDLLPADFTDSYRSEYKAFHVRYLNALSAFKRENLSENDLLSYDIFKWQLQTKVEGLALKDNLMPLSQFLSTPIYIGLFGSGTVIQPFNTTKDYDDWIKRATAFSVWVDSAIIYFRKGVAEGITLSKAVVEKVIPQLNSFITADPVQNIFYGLITHMPKNFSDPEKIRLTNDYIKLISEQLVPAHRKLRDFLQSEYLPKARTTSGIGAIPGGAAMYRYYLRLSTTTRTTAEILFNTGLAEVKRIRSEMDRIKRTVGFKGDLKAFLNYIRTDPKFFPYKTPEEVLTAYRVIQQRLDSAIQKMFLHKPKTPLEIRQTESFRAASTTEQYAAGLLDGSRPGIFYVPILDANKKSFANESIFAHEAFPGHHYQMMLQYENDRLPKFRQKIYIDAFMEGWALYAESLGKELGLYSDPYQKMANLSEEMHRAIRLVVDPGLHAKGWTRERAIKYMMDNEPISEQEATSEIERYMAHPGQAVAYKVGQMKLQALRNKYTHQLGNSFDLAAFHDEILKDGAMPLDILEEKMDAWAKKQKRYAVFNHIAIYVRNLDRSVDFYSKIFQFDSIPDPFPNRKITWFKIGEHSQLHIVQSMRDTIVPQDIFHFCFSVGSMDEFINQLKKYRIEYTDGNGKTAAINVRADGVKQIWLKDPDGYLVEVNDEVY